MQRAHLLAQGHRHAVCKIEMVPESASAVQHPVGTRGVAHQAQITTFFTGEIFRFDQHAQSRGCQILHTIEVHYHDLGDGQRLG